MAYKNIPPNMTYNKRRFFSVNFLISVSIAVPNASFPTHVRAASLVITGISHGAYQFAAVVYKGNKYAQNNKKPDYY